MYSLPAGQQTRPLQIGRFAPNGGVLRRVGGVMFEMTALPVEGFNARSIDLIYNPLSMDGSRLGVVMNGQTFTTDIPDWQLAPIAHFADSEYFGCVSLFGDSTNETHYNITYHEAFQNTLLGLRLLQYDILLMDPLEFSQKPMVGGKMLLGTGETSESDSKSVEEAYWQVHRTMYPYKYNSWVVTDYQTPVLFGTQGNRLSLTGDPWFYFWTSDSIELKHRKMVLYEEINRFVQNTFNVERQYLDDHVQEKDKNISKERNQSIVAQDSLIESGKIFIDKSALLVNKLKLVEAELDSLEKVIPKPQNQWNELITEHDSLATDYEKLNSDYQEWVLQITPEFDSLKTEIIRLEMEKKNLDSLYQLVYSKEMAGDTLEAEIYSIDCLNDEMKSQQEALETLAPDTYRAVINTMRYAAFFRYVKQNNPKAWKQFLDKIPKPADIQPYIQTPYLWERNSLSNH